MVELSCWTVRQNVRHDQGSAAEATRGKRLFASPHDRRCSSRARALGTGLPVPRSRTERLSSALTHRAEAAAELAKRWRRAASSERPFWITARRRWRERPDPLPGPARRRFQEMRQHPGGLPSGQPLGCLEPAQFEPPESRRRRREVAPAGVAAEDRERVPVMSPDLIVDPTDGRLVASAGTRRQPATASPRSRPIPLRGRALAAACWAGRPGDVVRPARRTRCR
jgi:hypothetical protein